MLTLEIDSARSAPLHPGAMRSRAASGGRNVCVPSPQNLLCLDTDAACPQTSTANLRQAATMSLVQRALRRRLCDAVRQGECCSNAFGVCNSSVQRYAPMYTDTEEESGSQVLCAPHHEMEPELGACPCALLPQRRRSSPCR